jgi:signal transduction histidine kinase
VNLRLSRLQTDFVSNVSHELRTPLTSIRMFVDTLAMDRARDEKQVKECLELLATETERLSNMVERLLQWARMEAGRRIYTLEPVSPLKVVEGAVNAFRAQTIGSPYKLEVVAPAQPPAVLADVDALTEALLNLLSNAFKYGGDEKRITVRIMADAEETTFEVEDDGIGISPRDKKRIFDKFYRAEQLLSRKTEGTGLGLSMVRHIVEGHKGRIEVESEPGKGSRFRMRLKNAPLAVTKPREVPA